MPGMGVLSAAPSPAPGRMIYFEGYVRQRMILEPVRHAGDSERIGRTQIARIKISGNNFLFSHGLGHVYSLDRGCQRIGAEWVKPAKTRHKFG
jgi:hypothetical protein